ncbi:MAG: rhodanese-like domain-containing protein [Cellulosilyticum sp.]|nr:rhodanese-like domain-containing protein [Cellulosilyticum sp.]
MDIDIKTETFHKNKKSYLMCQSGMRSNRVVSALKKAGYQVINVSGGMGVYTGDNRIK